MTKQNTANKSERERKVYNYLFIAYIALLVLEGALRKWFLTGLSDALLFARDPIVLIAYVWAFANNRFPLNKYTISGGALMLFCAAIAIVAGHGNPFVAAYGFRANYLHIPFAFLIGSIWTREDVINLGRYWLLGSVLMTAIIILQFTSPQSAWINQGVGGIGSAGFSGALGKFRPSGTFSFVTGIVHFYTFTAAFLIAGITQHNRYKKILLAAAAISLILSVPVSISRSLLLAVAITIMTGVLTSAFQKGAIVRYLKFGVIACVGIFIAGQFSVFDESTSAFTDRWERSTSEDKGGFQQAILYRTVTEFIGPFVVDEDIPFLGAGIGAGTQVGTKLLTGEKGFTLGEGEWFRITGEGGIILGTLFIFWRVWITIALAKFALLAYRKGSALGLIFLSATAYNLLIGQLGQSTINGFTVMGIGLTIAALKPAKRPTTQE